MHNARQKKPFFSILPEAIIGEILSRFPVKTLLKLKCVCKSWYTLISTPWFIYMHLRFNSNHYLLVKSTRESNSLIPIRNPVHLINLARPDDSIQYFVTGSINGLVCLTSTAFMKFNCLWNPSTNQFKKLPEYDVNLQDRFNYHVSVGFGYDPTSHDYKVVRILNNIVGKGRELSLVEVYSSNLDSWSEVKTDIHLHVATSSTCDAIVEGFTYWLTRSEDEPRTTVLTSFDVRNETFRVIPVPEELAAESHSFSAINYAGSLALLSYSSHYELKNCLVVWMVEGVSSGEGMIWSKKFTFGMGFEISDHWGLTNGDIVVKNAPNVPFLFNMKTKQRRIIGIDRVDDVFYYVESLVSVKGFKPVEACQIMEKRNA